MVQLWLLFEVLILSLWVIDLCFLDFCWGVIIFDVLLVWFTLCLNLVELVVGFVSCY